MKRLRGLAIVAAALAAICGTLYAYLTIRPAPAVPTVSGRVPRFSHVFLIVMENHSISALSPGDSPYIHQLVDRYGYDSQYFGVTHVSLPNYLALLSGTTHGTHSDNPDQSFQGPTLAGQMNQRHISWQGVMQSLPWPGYRGNWYPEPRGTNPTAMPKNALYAKKHDPFMLFSAIARHSANHVVPLTTLTKELRQGTVPEFVWITPNLCDDMHGQPRGSQACPANDPTRLEKMGNHFLATIVPEIMHSPSWTQNSVIFITWDEAETPTGIFHLRAWKKWLMAGPQSPQILGVPVGGGSVPLIAITHGMTKPRHLALWADHYNLLKTIEAGFRLPYLGHARTSQVRLLTPLVQAP